jgi:hypothetical protein
MSSRSEGGRERSSEVNEALTWGTAALATAKSTAIIRHKDNSSAHNLGRPERLHRDGKKILLIFLSPVAKSYAWDPHRL